MLIERYVNSFDSKSEVGPEVPLLSVSKYGKRKDTVKGGNQAWDLAAWELIRHADTLNQPLVSRQIASELINQIMF